MASLPRCCFKSPTCTGLAWNDAAGGPVADRLPLRPRPFLSLAAVVRLQVGRAGGASAARAPSRRSSAGLCVPSCPDTLAYPFAHAEARSRHRAFSPGEADRIHFFCQMMSQMQWKVALATPAEFETNRLVPDRQATVGESPRTGASQGSDTILGRSSKRESLKVSSF